MVSAHTSNQMAYNQHFEKLFSIFDNSQYEIDDNLKAFIKEAIETSGFCEDIDSNTVKVQIGSKQTNKDKNRVIITETKSGKGLWVSGATYNYRHELKQIGKWNKYKKSWVFSMHHKQTLLYLFEQNENDIGKEKDEKDEKDENDINEDDD